jgi:hypothetical protein
MENLEKIVCTYEQARKLQDLGVTQQTAYYWKENEIQTVVTDSKFKRFIERYLPRCNKYYSAYTSAELMKMLDKEADFMQYKEFNASTFYPALQIALADRLELFLLNKWITVEEVNNKFHS